MGILHEGGEGMSRAFSRLHPSLHSALEERGWEPTPVQEHALPEVAEGHDRLIIAPTGSGKTMAGILPLFHRCLSEGLAFPLNPLHHPTSCAQSRRRPSVAGARQGRWFARGRPTRGHDTSAAGEANAKPSKLARNHSRNVPVDVQREEPPSDAFLGAGRGGRRGA